ncbi:MAG: hypothetical protein LBT95_03395 [Treponema sp.]|nr:hypothetical protein [Treponema sp.]
MKNKTIKRALILLFIGMAVIFTACEVLIPGDAVRKFEKSGLYKIVNGERVLQEIAGEANLANALAIIRQDIVKAPTSYVIVLTKDESVTPQYLTPLGDNTRGNETNGWAKYNFAFKNITVEGLKPVTVKLKPAGDAGTSAKIPLFVVGTYDKEDAWATRADKGEIVFTLGENITLEGSQNNPCPLIGVIAGGRLIIDGAVITGNSRLVASKGGGGVGGGIEILDGGTLTMKGGTISNNSITISSPSSQDSPAMTVGGGAIYLGPEGTFIMDGGNITANNVTNEQGYAAGGGILMWDSSFTMNGGVISENAASSSSHSTSGGGICLTGSSQYNLTGGTVSGNKVSSSGASSMGGGIYVSAESSFTMTGGVISGNTALSSDNIAQGGGIFLAGSSQYDLTGGTVSGNSVSGSEESKGGGIYVATDEVFTPPPEISITDNTPDDTGSVESNNSGEEEGEGGEDENEGGESGENGNESGEGGDSGEGDNESGEGGESGEGDNESGENDNESGEGDNESGDSGGE